LLALPPRAEPDTFARATSAASEEKSEPIRIQHKTSETLSANESVHNQAASRVSSPYYYPAEWLDRRPVPLDTITPRYPLEIEGIAGKVRLLLLINENGGVDGYHILRSEPSGLFDEETIIAFAQARYAPGTKGGIPAKSQFVVEVEFSPDETLAIEK
jgi:TonB family protein